MDAAGLVRGHRRHAPGQLVLAVDLEHPLGELVELAVLLQEPLEPQVHALVLGHQADRAVLEPLGGADVGHVVA